jgi:hypothetical protein
MGFLLMSKYNMQNVFIWIDGNKGYNRSQKWKHSDEKDKIYNYLKIQIENSLDMGWEKENIIPITNFEFEHMGIKTNVAENFCSWSSFVNKLVVVQEMIEKGILHDNIWMHDCDCYQLMPFDFPEECKDWGYTKHDPKRSKNQGGSAFFRKEGYDIIKTISDAIKWFKPSREELFIPYFYKDMNPNKAKSRSEGCQEVLDDPESSDKSKYKAQRKMKTVEWSGMYKDRFTYLDYTYNLCIVKYFRKKYKQATKPIKVMHTHIDMPQPKNCFYFGENQYNVSIVTEDLEKLLLKYDFLTEADKKKKDELWAKKAKKQEE